MAKAITDQQVADALADFRERKKEEQERSVIWQELVQFPQWIGAQFTEGVDAKEVQKATTLPTPHTNAPPDPRLPASERARINKEQNPTKTVANPDGSKTIKTAASKGQSNPWHDYKEPPEGPCLLSVQTDHKPPFRGEWSRIATGWYRAS